MLSLSITLLTLLTFNFHQSHACSSDQCGDRGRYIVVPGPDASTPVRFWDAHRYCKQTYGTGLATVDSEEAQADAVEACIDSEENQGQKCWIGLVYNNGSTDQIAAYDEGLWRWVTTDERLIDTDESYNAWEENEPTTAVAALFGQFCTYINNEFVDNEWDDYWCAGYDDFTGRNNKIVSSFLCDNPNYVEDDCLCDCGCCMIEGDPHFTTFDDLVFHYMGQCSYYYVTTCDGDTSVDTGIPFEITGEHYECYQQIEGRTCMKSTWVRFYGEGSSEPAVIIKLGENFEGMNVFFSLLVFAWFLKIYFVCGSCFILFGKNMVRFAVILLFSCCVGGVRSGQVLSAGCFAFKFGNLLTSPYVIVCSFCVASDCLYCVSFACFSSIFLKFSYF